LTNLKKFPLRERKKAQTRLSLLDAVINRLYDNPLANITIEEICDDVEISKATFFLYFPQKTDVIVLYGLLWNLEALWMVTHSPKIKPGLGALESVFKWNGQKVDDHPRLWMEIVAIRALEPQSLPKWAAMGPIKSALLNVRSGSPALKGSKIFRKEILNGFFISTCRLP
jgi:AcrR family transcriptional regulator